MTIATPVFPARQQIVMEDVTWAYYEHTLEQIGDGYLRVTYDRGRMEIMAPSSWHDAAKTTIARLIEMYALEADVPIIGLGSTTCRREDLERGLEPDECYYLKAAPPVSRDRKLDLSVDPPPDLAVEVDVWNSSVPREPIYAALGVPEIWRFRGQQVTVLHRRPDGRYVPADKSLAFPDLAMIEFNRFLELALTTSQHAAVRAFRDWLRAGQS